MSKLALLGGKARLSDQPYKKLFAWPIITEEDEEAALDVIRNNRYSGTDITSRFERKFADYQGMDYALAYCNGTMAITAAMFAIGLGEGDEIICPTKTYWASITSAMGMGATPVFCGIDDNLSIDPDKIEKCISENTKAIMVVHYVAYPADMDRIMAIAKKHGLRVIEDVSHAQGGHYKGRKLGTFGDVSAMSMMSYKSFAAGELGMLVTNNRRYYERALAFAHYERNNSEYIKESPELLDSFGIALGGFKGRANQLCTALAEVQLKYYDERCKEIRRAMNYFCDLIEKLPGIRPIRVDESGGSDMAGWYCPHARYYPEELSGLSVSRFCEAVRAEGFDNCYDGGNYPLHTNKLFQTVDLYHTGKPTRIAHQRRDVRELDAECDQALEMYCFQLPWFKHFDKEWIEAFADVFKKVVDNHKELLEGDQKAMQGGRWFGTSN